LFDTTTFVAVMLDAADWLLVVILDCKESILPAAELLLVTSVPLRVTIDALNEEDAL